MRLRKQAEELGLGEGDDRVFEVRGHHEGETIVVDEILVGPRGLLKRLRGPGASARVIAWAQVSEIGTQIRVAG